MSAVKRNAHLLLAATALLAYPTASTRQVQILRSARMIEVSQGQVVENAVVVVEETVSGR